jgi:hypothetical protein
MYQHIRYVLLILCLLPATSWSATEQGLFDHNHALQIIIETDMQRMMSDKSADPVYQKGTLIHLRDGKKTEFMEIEVRARGNTRRLSGICEIPPLMLRFRQPAVSGTVFDGIDKIKLVNQCRNDPEYGQYVIREYLAYRSYNLLTEESFRVRPLRITYRDTQRQVPEMTLTGYFIEPEDLLAQRTGMELHKQPVYSQDSCEVEATNRLSLFQYMIGNTDWFVHTRHNIRIFRRPDGDCVPVPYDFDLSGVVNAIYALPAPNLGIRSVRDRFFMGSCRQVADYQAAIGHFTFAKAKLEQLIRDESMADAASRRHILRYYEQFYSILSNPELRDAQLGNLCRPDPFNLMLTAQTKKTQPSRAVERKELRAPAGSISR